MKNIFSPNNNILKKAKNLLESWEIVAFPTETVYWLWANAFMQEAVSKIFKLKNRPQNNPLIVHVWKKEQISEFWVISNPIEKKIIEKLMPWPITILLTKKNNLAESISSNDFIWIRIPSNQAALDLLIYSNLPIAAPSANISTKPSPTSAQMVYSYFGDKIPMIIDWGNCEVWIESTVIKVDKEIACYPMWVDDCKDFYKITIMRPGFVTKEDLQELFAKNTNVLVEYSSKLSNISPWNMYKHYSPKAKVNIIKDLNESLVEKLDQTIKIAIILSQETIVQNQNFIKELWENIQIINRWTVKNPITFAQSLFKIYRDCDQNWIDSIFIEHLQETWLWFSIMNRVKKSAEQ